MYILSKDYKLRSEEDGAGLLIKKIPGDISILNPVANSILSLLEEKSAELCDIVDHILCNFNKTDKDVETHEIQAFLNYAVRKGIVNEI